MAKYLDLNGLETVWGKITNKITESKADWNQNDESADDYVKNRTHWVGIIDYPLLADCEVSFNQNGDHYTGYVHLNSVITQTIYPDSVTGQSFLVRAGDNYTVIYNNVEYTCVCQIVTIGTDTGLMIGNPSLAGSEETGNNEPFCIVPTPSGSPVPPFIVHVNALPSDSNLLTITHHVNGVHKLDNQFIDTDNLPIKWEFIKNKPFTTNDIQIAVDFGYETSVTMSEGNILAKVSDTVLTKDQILNAYDTAITLYIKGSPFKLHIEEFGLQFGENYLFMVTPYITGNPLLCLVSVQNAGTTIDGLIFPESGTYFYIKSDYTAFFGDITLRTEKLSNTRLNLDTELNSESENPVQNKAIKAYIDEVISQLELRLSGQNL